MAWLSRTTNTHTSMTCMTCSKTWVTDRLIDWQKSKKEHKFGILSIYFLIIVYLLSSWWFRTQMWPHNPNFCFWLKLSTSPNLWSVWRFKLALTKNRKMTILLEFWVDFGVPGVLEYKCGPIIQISAFD